MTTPLGTTPLAEGREPVASYATYPEVQRAVASQTPAFRSSTPMWSALTCVSSSTSPVG
jgi:hypothetical protein